MGGDGRRRAALLVAALLLLFLVSADTESLNVATCSGGSGGCSVSGLNSDDTNGDGDSFDRDVALVTSWTNTTFDAAATIDGVTFIITHGGQSGITDNLVITLSNEANTVTYCSFSVPNTVSPQLRRTIDLTTNCSWTKTRLDDLEITISNTDGGSKQNAIISFLDMVIEYTPPDTTPPSISLNAPANRSNLTTSTVTFNYTPSDASGFSNCSLYLDGGFNATNATPVTNGAVNNFTVVGVGDGPHYWRVNCTDNGTFLLSNVSLTRNFTVDTTPPQVNLESPPNGNVSSSATVYFYFNVTDVTSTVSSCRLYANGTQQDSLTGGVAEGVSRNMTATLANGRYLWWVNCTDARGLTGMSGQRNITINVSDPTIVRDMPSYDLGDTVNLSGENWGGGTLVLINLTLTNGTVVQLNDTADGTGYVTVLYYVNYSHPYGAHSVFAYDAGDVTRNASTTVTVNAPTVTVAPAAETYFQGDQVVITGAGYSPSSSVNMSIAHPGHYDTYLLVSNATGGWTFTYNLTFDDTLGTYNISAYDTVFPNLNASDNFTVAALVASLQTNASVYGRNASVGANGSNYSTNGTVQVTVYDDVRGDPDPAGPFNVTADASGFINFSWYTNDTCNGAYRIEAVDQSYSNLNGTAYFNISEVELTSHLSFAVAGYNSFTAAAANLSRLNVSDNQRETVTASTTAYLEVNFTNSLGNQVEISSATVLIEHQENQDASKVSLSLQWWNASLGGYQSTGCSPTVSNGVDLNSTCTLPIANASAANDVSLRLVVTKLGGASASSSIDLFRLNVTTSAEPLCTYFDGSTGGGSGNLAPAITATLLEDGVLSPQNELDLTAGTTTAVNCTVNASDPNGYQEIGTVNATVYRQTAGLGAPDDPANHYTNASCTLVTGSGSDGEWSCGFLVQYYAENGTWVCSASIADSEFSDTDTDTALMNPLFALNVTPTLIDYGSFGEGGTSAEQTANVSNIGNTQLNLSVTGYGSSFGDGLSFNCSTGNVTLSAQRYASSSGAYASKTPLTASFVHSGLQVAETTDGSPSWNLTYWQVQVPGLFPENPFGVCNGTVVFQAEAP